MKKALLFVVTFLLVAILGTFVNDVWQSTSRIRQNGKEGTLRVGRQYNASTWSAPLPLKKVHAYTAVLAPKHEVVITSDQELVAGKQYFIRFIDQRNAAENEARLLRSPANSIRLRKSTDAAPEAFETQTVFERALDKAMGDPSKAAPEIQHIDTTSAVPFLIGGANDGMTELVWNNSSIGEKLFVLVLLLVTKACLMSAIFTPWKENGRERSEEKDFVHPALRKIAADPIRETHERITVQLKPKVPAASDKQTAAEAPADNAPTLRLPRR